MFHLRHGEFGQHSFFYVITINPVYSVNLDIK